jgi:hypothetical protein
MAVVLSWEGLGWTTSGDTAGAQVYDLMVGVASGGATYTAVLLAAWWTAGRPSGAETVFLDVLRGTLRHLLRARRKVAGTGG